MSDQSGVEPAGPDIDSATPLDGLERKWQSGETLPWKGIWFRTLVRPNFIILIPDGTTYKQLKRMEEARTEADQIMKGRQTDETRN